MKLDIDFVVNPQAAGPARADCAIVPGREGVTGYSPAGVAFVLMGEGRTVRVSLSTLEARAIGEMLLVCGAVAEGGSPPVIAPPASPLIINGGH